MSLAYNRVVLWHIMTNSSLIWPQKTLAFWLLQVRAQRVGPVHVSQEHDDGEPWLNDTIMIPYSMIHHVYTYYIYLSYLILSYQSISLSRSRSRSLSIHPSMCMLYLYMTNCSLSMQHLFHRSIDSKDLTMIPVPSNCVGFVTGSQGNFLRPCGWREKPSKIHGKNESFL